ncbi:MAG: YcgN family cysteine cluster protein [Gammaproteobacteria bacterium]|nr:MAG: YcgN family cysteine cluster protein [Gammaproteobacteria bacterium]
MFWKTKPLAEMNEDEWESLCDGCGQCCLVKLEDEENGEIFYTDVVCYLLDQDTCTCGDYQQRCVLVPDCVKLMPTNLEGLSWMPADCAYRRLAEGQDLAWWHPLVSGSLETVHESGVSVRGKVVIETEVDRDKLEDHIVDWVR